MQNGWTRGITFVLIAGTATVLGMLISPALAQEITPTVTPTETRSGVLPYTLEPSITITDPAPSVTAVTTEVTPVPEPTATQPAMKKTATLSYWLLRVLIFIDANNDGVMNAGEGLDGIEVTVDTVDLKDRYHVSAYTTGGVVEIVYPDLRDVNELVVGVPYLARSLRIQVPKSPGEMPLVSISLSMPQLPAYLP